MVGLALELVVGENAPVSPETHYALSGDIHIAYQVLGEGPFDLIFVPGFVTHVELQWELPGFPDFLMKLARFSRLIRFDKRGTGMSDPVSGAPNLETRMDDVRAVMDAVGSERAAFFGLSEGAAMSILFAATYPERVAALIVRSCSPRTLWAPDFPWGRSDAAYDREVRQAMRIYASRPDARAAVRRLGIRTEDAVESYIRMVRWAVSPGMLKALYQMNAAIDIREVLPLVRVPALVLHGADDQIVPVEVGRYVAEHLGWGRLVVLPEWGTFLWMRRRKASPLRSSIFSRTFARAALGTASSLTGCSRPSYSRTSWSQRAGRSSSEIAAGARYCKITTR